jgi:uncharacterized protein
MSENKDQSMEEILQSIKRIIADEEGADAVKEHIVEEEVAVRGSEILELKDMVEASPADHLASILNEPAHTSPEAVDVLGAIDAHFASPPTFAPVADHSNEDILASIDSLLDKQTVKASTDALQSLKKLGTDPHPVPPTSAGLPLHFRSGATLEDLVLEALKPELRHWLNSNLPAMVERLVSAEIKKITS